MKKRVFRQFLIVFMTAYSQQSTIKVGKGPVNVIQLASKSKKVKKRILDKIISRQQCFPAVINNQSPNSGFVENSPGIPNTIRV